MTITTLAVLFLATSIQGPLDQKPTALLDPYKKGSSPVAMSNLRGWVTAELDTKLVRLHWRWNASGPHTEHLNVQKELVAFWPTEAIGVGPHRVAVAGKQRANTVIELWELTDIPAPHGAVNQATGEWHYPVLQVPITDKTTVYAEATPGRDMVTNLFWNSAPGAGTDTSLFVQFFDSREVYRLDVPETGTPTIIKVASPTDSSSGIVFEPLLQLHNDVRWSGDHKIVGNFCHFNRGPESLLRKRSGGGKAVLACMTATRSPVQGGLTYPRSCGAGTAPISALSESTMNR